MVPKAQFSEWDFWLHSSDFRKLLKDIFFHVDLAQVIFGFISLKIYNCNRLSGNTKMKYSHFWHILKISSWTRIFPKSWFGIINSLSKTISQSFCEFLTKSVKSSIFQYGIYYPFRTLKNYPNKFFCWFRLDVVIFGFISLKIAFWNRIFPNFSIGINNLWFSKQLVEILSEIFLWIFRLLVPKAQSFNMKLLTLFRAFSKIAQRDFLFISAWHKLFPASFLWKSKIPTICPETPKWNIVIFGIFWKFLFEI